MSPRAVLITGANRGLGLEFVKQFLCLSPPPDHLFATCRDPTKAEDLQKIARSNARVKILQLDVNDLESIRNAKDAVESTLQGQGLNLLINNGAINRNMGLADVTSDIMIETYKTNVVGPLLTVQTFLPLLQQAADLNKDTKLCWERAAIFNITGEKGSIEKNTSGGLYAYRASKSALNHLTKNLSIELVNDGILAAGFHPGWVITEMGGPGACVTTEQSVQGLFNVFPKTDETCKGRVTDFTGEILPW